MITAMLMKKKHNVKDICVIDFDAHYGNGTDEIKAKLDAKFVRNYTFGEFANRILRDSGSAGFDNWLNSLGALKLIDIVMDGCDVIFYQAGADPHVDDPYGGYLTTNQMILRDKIVFEAAKRNNIPIVWNLAGGYQSPVQKVLDLHQNTLVECLKVYGDSL
jgi:acetoin utilization deacetylase AcuC-like enzyme